MKKFANALILLGCLICISSVALLLLIFYPVIKEEIRYFLSSKSKTVALISTEKEDIIAPIDTKFGIIIPKIGANAHVVKNVDPNNEAIYQKALTKGVAHALGTSFPGESGNIFLFAHSSVDFYIATQYNAVFYLISKLEKEDSIALFYNGQEYLYKVSDKKIIAPTDVSSLTGKGSQNTLTLMTCWPPGTTISRLLIIASPVEKNK